MHTAMTVIMIVLSVALVVVGAWLLTALALADPDVVGLRRHRMARRELGRAAARCRE